MHPAVPKIRRSRIRAVFIHASNVRFHLERVTIEWRPPDTSPKRQRERVAILQMNALAGASGSYEPDRARAQCNREALYRRGASSAFERTTAAPSARVPEGVGRLSSVSPPDRYVKINRPNCQFLIGL